MTGILLGFPRHTQHRALSRPGIADDIAEIAPVRDMRQSVGLLAGQDNAAVLALSEVRTVAYRRRRFLKYTEDRFALRRPKTGASVPPR